MDPADALLDKIFSLVDLEKRSADKLDKLASELEGQRKDVNISQVAGSAVSALGSAALITAGVLTGGAAAPVLAVGGAVVSWLGFGVSVGSEVVDAINPRKDEKEKQIYEEINDLSKEIQTLAESLAGEGKKAGISEKAQDKYVTELILRALAKRCGLILYPKVISFKSVFKSTKMGFLSFLFILRIGVTLDCFLIYKLVYTILKEQAGSKAGYMPFKSVVSASSGQVMKAAGSKASGKALKRIAQGTCGLVFSSAELIYNCATLNDCETVKSKSLRERAKEMKTHAENMKKELEEAERLMKELAEVKSAIENGKRSSTQKKKLIDFAKKQCEDEAVRTWLEENEKSEAFLKLVDLFRFLQKELNKQKMKIDLENIDIIFVAHGDIEDSLIPASCLLPLPTVQDVVLYSPWNCALLSDAAYGIATGRLELHHRVFNCGGKDSCVIPDRENQPADPPNHWNSMKKAKKQKIPTIFVRPLIIPGDGAWEHFEVLQDKHGPPGKNRILIPFILPGESEFFRVPFFVVTLALSLVLYFTPYKATVHLAACLGRCERISKRSKGILNDQYSYTIDETDMTSSEKMLDGTPTSRRFEKLFG